MKMKSNRILETWIVISLHLMSKRESNPRPFSVWGKCGENGFPQGDAENGVLRVRNAL